jgi:hypothetical protein
MTFAKISVSQGEGHSLSLHPAARCRESSGQNEAKKLTPFRGHRKGVQAENFYEPEATPGEKPRRCDELPK